MHLANQARALTFRLDWPRRDAHKSQAVAAPLGGQGAGEGRDAGLGGSRGDHETGACVENTRRTKRWIGEGDG